MKVLRDARGREQNPGEVPGDRDPEEEGARNRARGERDALDEHEPDDARPREPHRPQHRDLAKPLPHRERQDRRDQQERHRRAHCSEDRGELVEVGEPGSRSRQKLLDAERVHAGIPGGNPPRQRVGPRRVRHPHENEGGAAWGPVQYAPGVPEGTPSANEGNRRPPCCTYRLAPRTGTAAVTPGWASITAARRSASAISASPENGRVPRGTTRTANPRRLSTEPRLAWSPPASIVMSRRSAPVTLSPRTTIAVRAGTRTRVRNARKRIGPTAAGERLPPELLQRTLAQDTPGGEGARRD